MNHGGSESVRAHERGHAAIEPRGRGVLVVGAGGLSCPVLSVLARSGVTRFTLLDDDRVELSNLHRQTLYDEADVGRLKVEVAAERLTQVSPFPERLKVERVIDRLVPDNALALIEGHALVVEGADNFATKFLAADAAKLSDVAIVQAGAVRFGGWALGVLARGSACVRCVFEDIPRGQPETCSVAGVLAPVVGVLGALEAALALELLLGRTRAAGVLWSYDAQRGGLRRRRVQPRSDCPLCTGQVRDLSLSRYVSVQPS
ncbi:MAG: Sulfur carrier protein adenylyltransferase ThiF [Myxococcaceae bacterium]|nr:Sulfur carrier protein adenylyltransferase ThiF [Myxococcaceae bacterium]